MTDVIGLHELGHPYVTSYGINAHAWFNEFLASYFGYVFLQTARHTGTIDQCDGRSQTRATPPSHTSLSFRAALRPDYEPGRHQLVPSCFLLESPGESDPGLGF